jgi:5-methyltetrahydrofolate--homocysteine methyltransferase
VKAVKEHKPDVLGMSALLTTTMPRMGEVINSLKEAGIRDEVAVIIGGAPVTQEFADEIGADLYAPNAGSAVDITKEFFEKKKS